MNNFFFFFYSHSTSYVSIYIPTTQYGKISTSIYSDYREEENSFIQKNEIQNGVREFFLCVSFVAGLLVVVV
jgi:hypothetical protein